MSEQQMVIASIIGVIIVVPSVLILYAFTSLYRSFVSTGKHYQRAKQTLHNVFPEVVFIPFKSPGFWGWFIGERFSGEMIDGGESFFLHLSKESSSESAIRPLSLEISKKLRRDSTDKFVLSHEVSVYRTPKLLHRPPVSTGKIPLDKAKGQFRRINSDSGDITIATCPSFIAHHFVQEGSFAPLNTESLSQDSEIISDCSKLLQSEKVLFVTIGSLGVVEICLAWDTLDLGTAELRATIKSYCGLLTQLHNKILRRLSRS